LLDPHKARMFHFFTRHPAHVTTAKPTQCARIEIRRDSRRTVRYINLLTYSKWITSGGGLTNGQFVKTLRWRSVG